jgi:anti-anti-sigma factor
MSQKALDIPGLEISTGLDGRLLVVAVVGRIDAADYDRAVEAFRQALLAHRWVIVDGTCTEHLSSNGIGVLVYYARQVAARGGELVVVRPPDGVLSPMSSRLLERALRLFDTRQEAERCLGPRAAPRR